MEIHNNVVRTEAIETLRDVQKQIDEVSRQARHLGTEKALIRDVDGGWVMIPLLLAKAQCLNTLALLKEKR